MAAHPDTPGASRLVGDGEDTPGCTASSASTGSGVCLTGRVPHDQVLVLRHHGRPRLPAPAQPRPT
jgi:hypothetical protein